MFRGRGPPFHETSKLGVPMSYSLPTITTDADDLSLKGVR